ncbi:MAG: BMP family ABC transporter substrate-binding protein [Acidimicrobiia bacterium]
MKRYLRYLALISALALVLAACGDGEGGDTTTTAGEATTTAGEATTTAGEETTTSAAGDTTTSGGETAFTPVKACFVTDDAGVDDRSFNASGWQGVQDAAASGAAQPDPILLESTSEADYQPHIETCLAEGAEHIVGSGFKLGPTIETFAAANPDVQFTLIDAPSNGPNVAGTEFQTDEAAFAAGYLAAGMTQTDIVATYGGVNIPTVSIFMDGYARGVAHYNEVNGAAVQVLGWDPADPEAGVMTGVFDPADPIVRATCESQLDEGADIFLPVGGAINLPCGTAMQDRGIDGALIGVDADAFDAMPAEFQDLWMVTILKGLAGAVTGSIEAHASGQPLGGSSYVGNLANDGVGLSDYHSWTDRVPPELDAEVQQILADIEAGTITWEKYVVGAGG